MRAIAENAHKLEDDSKQKLLDDFEAALTDKSAQPAFDSFEIDPIKDMFRQGLNEKQLLE